MKKFFNLFMLCVLACFGAVSAQAYDVVLYTDGAVNCKDGSAWAIGATTHSISTGFNAFSASNKNLMMRGSSNNSTFAAVKMNGDDVSKSGSGNGWSPNSYNADLGKAKVSPIFIEVYTSSASPAFSYPLAINASGDTDCIKSIQVGDNTYTLAEFGESQQFTYGVSVTVTTTRAPIDDSVSAASKRPVTSGRDGDDYTFTFIPCPIEAGETFNIEIPAENYIPEYYFTAQIQNDNEASFLANIKRYTRNCDHDAQDNLSFNEWGSCKSPFHVGDTYSLVLTSEPEAISFAGEPVTSFTTVTSGESVYYEYTITPTADDNLEYLSITFNEESTGGGEEPQPTEETFKIYLNPDISGAVKAVVYSGAGVASAPVILPADVDTELVCSVNGRIEVSVTDNAIYAFNSFVDSSNSNADYLNYTAPSTEIVTIRNTRKLDQTTNVEHDGHVFKITVADNSNLTWYNITLDIVDDASNIIAEVGSSSDDRSQANRRIEDLKVGSNQIKFSENDAWIVISSADPFTAIYDVKFDKGDVIKTESLIPVYKIAINAESDGGVVTVTATKPVVAGDKSFTFDVDHVELISSLKRFENQDDWMGTAIDLATLHDGENTLTFSEGEFFRMFIGDRVPESCTIDNTDIELEFGTRYEFTPTEACTVKVVFGEEKEDERNYVTVITDRPDLVAKVANWDSPTDEEFAINDTETKVYYNNPDDHLRLYLTGAKDPQVISYKEQPLTQGDVYTEFTPGEEGGILRVNFSTTGVNSIVGNATNCNIYNAQGILIKADASADDLKNLPAGMYIHNGRKFIVK